MKLERRLANLGYGSRREVRRLFARRAVTSPDGLHLQANDIDVGQDILVHGEPLDPRPPIVLALHKPVGAECTRKGDGPTVYDLLPPRFLARSPKLAPVGRLDKDTTGLLLLTDDGELLHRLTHPRHHVDKRYLLRTARPLQPGLSSLFASGTMRLKSDSRPLLVDKCSCRWRNVRGAKCACSLTERGPAPVSLPCAPASRSCGLPVAPTRSPSSPGTRRPSTVSSIGPCRSWSASNERGPVNRCRHR